MSEYGLIIGDLFSVFRDVAPVLVVALFFQFVVLRARLPNAHRIAGGFLALVVGLYLFIVGLDMGIFPIGEAMAEKFSHPDHKQWTIAFAFCIGYATTMAEPALLAVTKKAEEVSSGGLQSFRLRNIVAIGVAIGLAVGVQRIFNGDPLWIYILSGYATVLMLTWLAPKEIVPLAYDSGGVTTSTITVPLVAALGLGLASNTPGRDPLIDGFGLIAFASVFPMVTVLGYAVTMKTIVELRRRGDKR
ncbi:MAG: DUF1538 domain-containing protein [Nitrospinota bacterium]|nr:DUF1538 domain-containing protein [Nitrospinota bacterium]